MIEPSNLDELLRCEGEMFVQAAYSAILKRKVDPQGFRFYLDRLNGGVAKLQIVRELAESQEGSTAGSELQGLRRALWLQRLASLPLLGAVIGKLANVEGNSHSCIRLRALEQKSFGLERALDAARVVNEQVKIDLEAMNARLSQKERELRDEVSRRFEELRSRCKMLETQHLAATRENASKLEAQTLAMDRTIEGLRDLISNSLQGMTGELELVRASQKTCFEAYQAQTLEMSKYSQMNMARLESQIASVKSRLKLT